MSFERNRIIIRAAGTPGHDRDEAFQDMQKPGEDDLMIPGVSDDETGTSGQ